MCSIQALRPAVSRTICFSALAVSFLLICLVASATAAFALSADAAEGNRQTSVPPNAAVTDLAFDGVVEQQLNWTLYRNGDYDQNGEVNVSDVTQIGIHYGKTATNLGWHVAVVADGDGNGEVNISDLTSIGQNFGSRVTHFQLYYAVDELGPYTLDDQFGTSPFSGGEAHPDGGPLAFSHYIAYPRAGNYYAVVAVDGTLPADSRSNSVLFDPVNLPPIASYSITSISDRMINSLVLIDGSNSTDPDGFIVEYAWDFTNSGELTPGLRTVEYLIETPGSYSPVLRVTDDQGATSTTIIVDPYFNITDGILVVDVLDDEPGTGNNPSIAMFYTRPGVAYDRTGAGVYFMMAGDQWANSWSAPVSIASPGSDPDLYKVGDHPAVSFFNDALYYSRANDEDGASWPGPVFVAEDLDVDSHRGYDSQLFFDFDVPAIADRDSSETVGGNIWYTRASDSEGNGWSFSRLVSASDAWASMPTISLNIDGLPFIAWEQSGSGFATSVYLAWAEDWTGANWDPATKLVQSMGARMSRDCSVVASSRNMVLAFWSSDQEALYASRTFTGSGLAWHPPVQVVPVTGTRSSFSLALLNQIQPAISYYDHGSSSLMLIMALDSTGETWGTPRVLDSGSEFRSLSMVDYEGWPMVAYQDTAAETLKLARIIP